LLLKGVIRTAYPPLVLARSIARIAG
jgi:hypothetical protein